MHILESIYLVKLLPATVPCELRTFTCFKEFIMLISLKIDEGIPSNKINQKFYRTKYKKLTQYF